MQIDGTLETFPLRELIEMVIYSSVTGVLELRVGNGVGQVFFRDGRPYHAAAGDLDGSDALGALFEERTAPFRFVADRETENVTLWADPWDMLEHAEQQAQRWLALRKHIPYVECVPALRELPATAQVQISETVWPVLAAVDGRRSVKEIAEFLNWVLLDTCSALVALIDRGLIAINAPRTALNQSHAVSAREDIPPPATPNRTSGFLERLLAEAQAQEQRPNLTDDDAQDRKKVYRYVDDRR